MYPEIGEVFDGVVTEVVAFGSFVERPGGKVGLLYGETAEPGSVVTVRVLHVDREKERFSLARV